MEAGDAIEAVAFAKLTAGEIGAPVYQHVPQDEPPPVVIVGDIDVDAEPLGGKGDNDERVTLTVVTILQGEARKPLLAIQGKIKTTLNNRSFSHGGWTLHFLFAGSDGGLLDDGETYVGNSRFTVLALSEA